MGFSAGDQNLYRYVGNEPIGAVDPTGLAEIPAVTVLAKPVDGVQGHGTDGGISITATTTDKSYQDKIKFIQFVQISAQVQFTYSKTCQGTSSYVTVPHEHGGATFFTSDPSKPYWNLDNHGKKDNPEYHLDDLTPVIQPAPTTPTKFSIGR